MNIEVKEIETCKLHVDYSSDPEEISEKLNQVMDSFKNVPVSGFRRGKAPQKVIRNQYKNQINESLKGALLEEAYQNIIFEKNISILGKPQVTSTHLSKHEFKCSILLHTKPDFDIKDYKSYNVPTPHESLDVNDLTEQMIEDLRARYGEAVPYEDSDTIQLKDNVILNYVGTLGGERLDSVSADGEMLTVGASKLSGFDNNLIGMSIDEIRTFDVKVPEGGLPSLAGKTITFEVTLVTGSRIAPAPLDDVLAKRLGKNTFQELRAMVMASASQRLEDMRKSDILQKLSNKMVNDYDFDIPQWLVLPEAKNSAQRAGVEWDSLSDEDKESFIADSLRNSKLSLILDKIRTEDPDATLSNEEIYETVRNTLIQFSKGKVTEENIKDHMKSLIKTGQYQVIASQKLDEHTLNYVLSLTDVVE